MLAPSMDCKTMFTYRLSSYLLKNSILSSIVTRSVSAELLYIQSFSATPSLAEFHYPRIFALITYIHTLASTRLQSSLQLAYISSMDTSKQVRYREAAASLPVNQPRSQTTQFPPMYHPLHPSNQPCRIYNSFSRSFRRVLRPLRHFHLENDHHNLPPLERQRLNTTRKTRYRQIHHIQNDWVPNPPKGTFPPIQGGEYNAQEPGWQSSSGTTT